MKIELSTNRVKEEQKERNFSYDARNPEGREHNKNNPQ